MRRAKIGVTAAFVAHAVVFSSWAAHIPHVKAALGLSDGALGTALFGAPLGSVAATLFSHWALPRWGSRRLVPVLVAGYAIAPLSVGLARSGLGLFGSLMLWGWFQGALDVAMNTQAGTLERLAQAPMMARFHGMWSLGALLGAVIGAGCVSVGVGLEPQLLVLGAAVLVVVGPLTLRLIADETVAVTADERGRTWTPTVVILAAVAFASFLCEGAATDWSANYLHDVVGAGAGLSALSYAAYTLAMVLIRFGAMRLHARLSARRLLPALALLAAVGMSVTLAAGDPLVSVIGFASLGAGVALLVPTAFSAAYSAGSGGSAIALVAATGWVGYLLGPPLIGHLAQWAGLSVALVTIPVVISVAALAIAATPAFDAADEFHRR
ncbi:MULTISPECIES: MFS transporter [Mycobacterium]|uniref:MFS transporter n=1 Tax=Mycobacterium TaxID=1763 RepID=UPI0009F6F491|nr:MULTISPECIES: MFS transporter [Mycobacterium]MBI2702549.1 MFS transporter [Mycobacterium sp.]MCV7004996.1 MFS transporter [Mycobacterium gordonae]PJE13078.1 MAG: MFS transporter [Mycobacterium sp.]